MKVVFKPSQPGLPKVVSGAERPILELLWEKGPLTGREIYDQVRHPKALAYTTVLTLVGRMVKKGIVLRQRVDGLLAFKAAITRVEFEERVAEAVVKGILEISPSSAVSTFVDVISEWDEGRLDEVMEIIEKKRKAERQ
jgi:predicted transcriptional regulator